MDPFEEIHEDAHKMIFQHLTVEEFLEFSLVSKSWYKVIGTSSKAMNKIWLNVGDRFNEPKKKDLRAFRASERHYQNFKMSEIENGLQILLFPKREWKRAKIDIQSFINFRDYVNLLKIFCKSIVDLEIYDMDIEEVNCDTEVLDFCYLEKLRIGFVTSFGLKPFIGNHLKLEKLILEDISEQGMKEGESAQDLIVKLLVLQPQLTHLSLSNDAFCKVFENYDRFDFQLKYLLIDYQENCETEEKKLMKNFEAFISTQNNLRWITFCDWTFADVIVTVFRHCKMERLSFDYFDGDSKKLDISLLKLNQNFHLKQIDFDCELIDLCWFKPFLEAAPFITTLYFFHVSQELLIYLVYNLKHLKYLKYCSIFDRFIDFYCSLKQQPDAENINCNISIIEDKFLDLRRII